MGRDEVNYKSQDLKWEGGNESKWLRLNRFRPSWVDDYKKGETGLIPRARIWTSTLTVRRKKGV